MGYRYDEKMRRGPGEIRGAVAAILEQISRERASEGITTDVLAMVRACLK